LAQLQGFEEQRRLAETARQQRVTIQEPVAEAARQKSEVSEAPRLKRGKAIAPPSESQLTSTLQLHPPKGEKVAGVLARLECLDDGVVFVVKSGAKTLRLHAGDPEKLLLFKKNGESLGTISMTCGPVSPPSPVVATYRQSATPSVPYDGVLLNVLFLNR
jgi:hypothetical protein